MNNNIVIKTENLSFLNMINYGNLNIHENKINFIVGGSGTGKSTLLKLFNTTLSQSSGKIYYRGQDLDDLDTIDIRRKILLIGQNVFLFDLSIKDNFLEFYKYRNEAPPTEEDMKKYLEMCMISFPLDKDCTNMSGGERQRVYIAIMMSFLPDVLMLDEPTSALDNENSHNLMTNITTFCKENNITVVIVSHNPSIIDAFGENIITLGKKEERNG